MPALNPSTTAHPPNNHQGERLAPGSALVIGLLMGSTFLVLLNEMLLGVALPTLITDLEITPSTGQWLTTGYLLTLAVLIPATGFVMRRFHMRKIFLTAMALFILGTAVAAAAPGFGVLFTGRIIQAVGTAVFVPLLMTTAMRLVPEARRGSIMALVTAVPAIAPALGPGSLRTRALVPPMAVAVHPRLAHRRDRAHLRSRQAQEHHDTGTRDT